MGTGFSACSAGELGEAIGQLHALHAATHKTMLEVIAAFDQEEGWREDGATSVVPWLVAALGVSHRTAAEWARVARQLEELPALARAYGDGRLSWDQLRPVLSLATPETDEELAEAAPGWSAAHAAAIARRARVISEDEAHDAHRRRSLHWWWGADRSLRLVGRLPDADGAVVVRALERLADAAPPEEATGQFEPYDARCADALVELASSRLAADGDADRATVVVHTDVATLTGEAGAAEIEGGPAVAAETARRLACDGRLQLVADGFDGRPLGVGRVTRAVPPWLVRLLRRRDGGCRFPACGRMRWTDAHHLVHWADGGRTDSDNLAILCRPHHTLLHEGGWRIAGNPEGELRFIRSDGEVLTTGPPGLREDVRRRWFGPDGAVA